MKRVEYLIILCVVRQRGGNGGACAHRENVCRGVEIRLQSFLTSEPDGHKRSGIVHSRVNSIERTCCDRHFNVV